MNILTKLYRKNNNKYDICLDYSGEKMVTLRLNRLENLGMIKKLENRYIITNKGLKFLDTLKTLRNFFKN